MKTAVFLLAFISSLCFINAQVYNTTSLAVVNNVTCSFTSQVATYPTYKLSLQSQSDGLSTSTVPVVTCLGTASPATITAVNTWTSVSLGNNITVWSTTVMLETLYKCLGVYSTSATQMLIQAIANFNVTNNVSGSVEATGNCTVQVATNNTGVAVVNYTAGSVFYSASLVSTAWVNTNQFQYVLQTCFVKPSNYTSFLYNPIYSIESGTGYTTTGPGTTPSCTVYTGQNGCCQNWTSTTVAISANSSSWLEGMDFTMNTGYVPLNGSNFHIDVLITAVKPASLINITSSSYTLATSVYGNSALTFPLTNAYDGNKIYIQASLPSSDCNTYVLTIAEMDICYPGVAGLNISGCSDTNAVLSVAYLPTGLPLAQVTLWGAAVTTASNCTSVDIISFIANILGPQATTNPSITMFAKISYYFTQHVGYGLRRRRIVSDLITYETGFSVGCQPGYAYDNTTGVCVLPPGNNSGELLAVYIVVPIASVLVALLIILSVVHISKNKTQ